MVKTMLLTILRTLIILLFSIWIVLWFLKPTNFWTKTWRRVEDSVQKSSFKYNGVDFLVYVFPIILLNVLALIFMYFQPRSPIRRGVRRYLTALYNPVIVKTPLGMLSGIDVIAMSLVLTLLVWTFYARISNDYNKLVQGKHLKFKIWQLKFLKVSTRFGLMAEICLAFLLFPVLRELSVFRMMGVQFEGSVRYHIWVGTMLVFFATLHGVGTLFIWGINHQIQTQIWSWEEEGLIHLAGVIALVTLLVIWGSSLPLVRRNQFELFYYIHHMYVVFIVLFMFHAGDRHFYMVFAGVILFAIDKLLRIIHSNPKTCIHSVRIFPTSNTIELTFPKDPKLSYTPTSIIFIKIPMISKFQWHPFSIASSCTVNDQTISVMIKCVGCWTNSLYKMLYKEVELNSSLSKCIPVALEGPYGPPASFDFFRYDNLLFIAGGIGISPILSILQEISSTKGDLSNRSQHQHLHLVYVTKKSQDISLLTPISHSLLNQISEFHHLKLTVFVTQEQKGGSSSSLREQLISFPTMPIILFDIKNSNYTYTFGTGSFNPVWKGAITGFSSVIFLLSLCFFNLFLFAPKQKTPKPKSPSLVLNLCMLCSLLIAVASGALVAMALRWRNLRKEGEVQSTTWDNRDEVMELSVMEGASTDTLDEHEIHYGARPIFKDLLPKIESEFRGSNMGVVVCGPEAMKESVASACHEKCRQPSKQQEQQHYAFHSLNFSL